MITNSQLTLLFIFRCVNCSYMHSINTVLVYVRQSSVVVTAMYYVNWNISQYISSIVFLLTLQAHIKVFRSAVRFNFNKQFVVSVRRWPHLLMAQFPDDKPFIRGGMRREEWVCWKQQNNLHITIWCSYNSEQLSSTNLFIKLSIDDQIGTTRIC